MRRLITGILLLCFRAGCADAQPVPTVPYALAQSSVFSLTAEHGEAYDILVSWPDGDAPAGGYPVLFLLDGRDHFAVATETARRLHRFGHSSGVGPGLIVGIDSGTLSRRAKDLTPDISEAMDRFGREIGGAAAFRTFLNDVVMPEIAARYSVDAQRQHVFGHSYGGLFVLDTLVERPEMFAGYFAASPSLWFGEGEILDRLSVSGDVLSQAGQKRVYLTIGSLEQPSSRRKSGGPGVNMVKLTADMADALSAETKLHVTHKTLSGEDHGMTSLSTVGWAVRIAFQSGKGDHP